MKRLHLTIVMVTLLLSQWGIIDHAFHEHVESEVCDYCITAKPFDDAVTSSDEIVVSNRQNQTPAVLLATANSKTRNHFYSVRAPPHLI